MATLNELFETYVNDNFSGVMSEAAIVKAYELLLGLTGDFPAKDERVQFWVDKELTVSDFVDEFLAAAARLSTENAAAWGETTAGRTAVVTAAQDEVATATTLEEVGAAVATARAENPVVTGETFTLTTGTDSLVGTDGNDTFNADTGTLATADTILDSTTDDQDVFNATVSSNSLAPRIQNVETLNITGKYATTGLGLASVSGTKTLNLDTAIASGSATVTDASSLNAEAIVAGDNVSTLSVTATASGTRDSVAVDANKATTVTVAGGAGADVFDVTLGDGASATINGGGSVDSYTVNVGATATLTGNTATEAVTLVAEQDSVVTLGGVLTDTVTNVETAKTTVTGSGNVTIKGTNAQLDDTAIASTAASLTVTVTDAAVGVDLKSVEATTVNLAVDPTVGTVIVNEASVVNLQADSTTTINVNNTDETLDVNNNGTFDAGDKTGTLMLNVSESSTSITTGAHVGTLLLKATPDEVSDTANGAQITIATLNTAAGTNTETVVVQGDANLKITTFTNDATASVLSATSMTGNLTIGDTAAAGSFLLGSGNDTILDTANAAVATIHAGAGNDTITTGTGDNVVKGEAGNDTITTSSGGDTIDGGEGDDTITASTGDNTVTTGAGSDTVVFAASAAVNDGTDDTEITDFEKGTDTILLTGTTTDTDVDLTSIAVAAGAYTFTDEHIVTLTGLTATDLSDSVQLGKETATFTVADDSTTVAGAKNDHITVATDDTASITTGSGSDVVVVTAGSGTDTVTVTDFAVGTDTIVLAGTATGDFDLNSTQTAGTYTLNSGEFLFDLTGKTETTLETIVQLGSSSVTFTAATATTIVAGDNSDYIATAASGTTSADSITAGKGKDYINLTASATGGTAGADVLVVAAGDSLISGWDEITAFEAVTGATADKLDFASTNIASVIGTTQVGDITGVTVANGVITAWEGIANTINADTLADALEFLAVNVGGTDTVAFLYTQDENNDGDTADTGEKSTFVFQAGTTDSVVELIGVTGITAVSDTAAANTVLIG